MSAWHGSLPCLKPAEYNTNLRVSTLGRPATLSPAKSDPIFYFVYPVEYMLELKRRIPIWIAKLRNDGFDVQRISLSELLWQLIDESGRYEAWLELEASADVEQINEAVRGCPPRRRPPS